MTEGARNGFAPRAEESTMALDDPIFLGIIAAVVLFFFFLYLMVRRTMVGFREGMERGRGEE